MSTSILSTAILYIICTAVCKGGWVDPDTKEKHFKVNSFVDGREYDIVFSDEFETEGRSFKDGHDPRWTAINKDDYTNYALHYYNASLVSTNKGFLNITTVVDDITFTYVDALSSAKPVKKTKNYQSAMIQGWNKFCFTGGIIEVSAQLPGRSSIGGLWPAMWMLGNLARATYVGSSNNIWPWSYKECEPDLQHQQRFSACNSANHYDLRPHFGRGAPEIDILEAMPGKEKLRNTPVNKPYYSASLQVAPGVQKYRPTTGEKPNPRLWYNEDLKYGKNSSLNIFFYGMHLAGQTKEQSYLADAISANSNLTEEHFSRQNMYRIEWIPGPQGYIKWWLNGDFIFGLSAKTLALTGAAIPEEPMYLLFNTAVSSTWGFPQPCPDGCACDCFDCRLPECACAIPNNMCKNLPASMLIDHVRVYQLKDDETQIVGCSTPTHPTRRYIQGHPAMYKSVSDRQPLKPVLSGGGKCKKDSDCGTGGECTRIKCSCLDSAYTGPYCKTADGFDDIIWDQDETPLVYFMVLPQSLFWLAALVLICLCSVVALKYKHERRIRDLGMPPETSTVRHMLLEHPFIKRFWFFLFPPPSRRNTSGSQGSRGSYDADAEDGVPLREGAELNRENLSNRYGATGSGSR